MVSESERFHENHDSENLLIFGDNLEILPGLKHRFVGKIQCVYLDPPFNTGTRSKYYKDGMTSVVWLRMLKTLLEAIKPLMKTDGLLFLHLDVAEMAYAKVLFDGVLGREAHLNTITLTTSEPSGFKATSDTNIFSTAKYILIYGIGKKSSLKKAFVVREYDSRYARVILNRHESPSKWRWNLVSKEVARIAGFHYVRMAKTVLKSEFDTMVSEFAIQNSEKVFRLAPITGGAKTMRLKTIQKSRRDRKSVFVHPQDTRGDFFILNGEQIVFYSDRLMEIDGAQAPVQRLTDVWTDIPWTGIAGEGGVEFKNGKKPEALMKRILELSTETGDWVLDPFAGSGTTGAVAHKMGRNWIMCESGKHLKTHIIPRIQRVVAGTDQTGISTKVHWKGGGSFRIENFAL